MAPTAAAQPAVAHANNALRLAFLMNMCFPICLWIRMVISGRKADASPTSFSEIFYLDDGQSRKAIQALTLEIDRT